MTSSITNSTSSPLSAANYLLQKTPGADPTSGNAAAGSAAQAGQANNTGSKSGGAGASLGGGGSSSSASGSSGSSTTIVSQTSVTDADGSVTTTVTYADGSTSTSTTPPDNTKASYAYLQEQKHTGEAQAQTPGKSNSNGATDILV